MSARLLSFLCVAVVITAPCLPSALASTHHLVFAMTVTGLDYPADYDRIVFDDRSGGVEQQTLTATQAQSLRDGHSVRLFEFPNISGAQVFRFKLQLRKDQEIIQESSGSFEPWTVDPEVRLFSFSFDSSNGGPGGIPTGHDITILDPKNLYADDSPTGSQNIAAPALWVDADRIVAIYDFVPNGFNPQPIVEISFNLESWTAPGGSGVIQQEWPVANSHRRVHIELPVPQGVERYFARVRTPDENIQPTIQPPVPGGEVPFTPPPLP